LPRLPWPRFADDEERGVLRLVNKHLGRKAAFERRRLGLELRPVPFELFSRLSDRVVGPSPRLFNQIDEGRRAALEPGVLETPDRDDRQRRTADRGFLGCELESGEGRPGAVDSDNDPRPVTPADRSLGYGSGLAPAIRGRDLEKQRSPSATSTWRSRARQGNDAET
jgi:hypothetical protein